MPIYLHIQYFTHFYYLFDKRDFHGYFTSLYYKKGSIFFMQAQIFISKIKSKQNFLADILLWTVWDTVNTSEQELLFLSFFSRYFSEFCFLSDCSKTEHVEMQCLCSVRGGKHLGVRGQGHKFVVAQLPNNFYSDLVDL